MEAQQFDHVTRQVAMRRSRRQALGVLLGALASMMAGNRSGNGAATAKDKDKDKPCHKDKHCAAGEACVAGTCCRFVRRVECRHPDAAIAGLTVVCERVCADPAMDETTSLGSFFCDIGTHSDTACPHDAPCAGECLGADGQCGCDVGQCFPRCGPAA